MAYVSIEGLTKNFKGNPPTTAVDDLHLEIEEGEFLVLLGPSGCGKTTTLRCLAGLERPAEGRIVAGSSTVYDSARRVDVAPDKRSIGMVFQSYALWPHMTVRKNIRYPLAARHLRDKIKDGSVERIAEAVHCGGLLDRYPAQLSGGQQQRVALARGLVSEPDLVLFDEPLSNLDARLRQQVRAELHELHRTRPFTAVFVTHDQSEALSLGQRMAIMRTGTIEQIGNPREVFEHPVSDYVAEFIGMSERLELTRNGDGWSCDGQALEANGNHVPISAPAGVVRLRPDDLRLVEDLSLLRDNELGLEATVMDVSYGGRHLDVSVQLTGSDTRVNAQVSTKSSGGQLDRWATGERTVIAFELRNARYFELESSLAVAA
ncbi:ATP-binding cassette domain-containing protein [Gordonia sp. HNM0687]|uniref:Trehalose import ATP-binding protein SugC n=1 Tax=Gordonia mangrovi TaxID=2665643 RepID=A0A6L7GX97_9ACTN|nr:ABC transporter ATP-binding protein [Gordonia mangrovi]MXP24202.1 ATP-binding cassette domain-containing protein [Gordonia mangrovi]UVF76906.1 ABC transporter ATP-binding protein [Gordonia mangrovi]